MTSPEMTVTATLLKAASDNTLHTCGMKVDLRTCSVSKLWGIVPCLARAQRDSADFHEHVCSLAWWLLQRRETRVWPAANIGVKLLLEVLGPTPSVILLMNNVPPGTDVFTERDWRLCVQLLSHKDVEALPHQLVIQHLLSAILKAGRIALEVVQSMPAAMTMLQLLRLAPGELGTLADGVLGCVMERAEGAPPCSVTSQVFMCDEVMAMMPPAFVPVMAKPHSAETVCVICQFSVADDEEHDDRSDLLWRSMPCCASLVHDACFRKWRKNNSCVRCTKNISELILKVAVGEHV